MFVQNIFTGLRVTSWSKLVKDISAIAIVLLTPYAVQRLYSGIEYGQELHPYINAVYYISPFIAIFMVLMLNYRLYRAGCVSSRR